MFLPKSDNNNSYCETTRKKKHIADKFTFFHVIAKSSKLWIYGLDRVSHFFKVIENKQEIKPFEVFSLSTDEITI